MHFNQIPEVEQVRFIREAFDSAIEEIASDPSKLDKYYKAEPPKMIKPTLIKIDETWSEEVKASTKEINDKHLAKVNEANHKLEEEFKAKMTQRDNLKKMISSLPKPEFCFCNGCIDLNSIKGYVASEYDVIIQYVRSDLEKRTF